VTDVIPRDLFQLAKEIYELEMMTTVVNDNALEKAIAAVLPVYERYIVARVIAVMRLVEEEIDPEDDEAFTAMCIRKIEEMPDLSSPGPEYVPGDGDLVEIILRGRVDIAEEFCKHCGETSESVWSLVDNDTRMVYYFDISEISGSERKLNIRVLHREAQ